MMNNKIDTIRYKDLAHAELAIGMTLAVAKRKLKEFKDKFVEHFEEFSYSEKDFGDYSRFMLIGNKK